MRYECGVGKEPSAGAGPSTDERGQLQSSPQLQQQRAVLASLAVDPGAHHENNNTNKIGTSRDGVCCTLWCPISFQDFYN